MFPIEFETNYVETTTKRIFVQHTITLDDFLKEFIWHHENNSSDEAEVVWTLASVKAKWEALTPTEQSKVFDEWKSNHPFSIQGHGNCYEDDNHLECFDDEQSDQGSCRGEDDEEHVKDAVRQDLFERQDPTWAVMDNLFSTPAQREAKQVADLEAEVKKLDEGFVVRAEKLKADFMKEMAKARAEVEAKQEAIRKTLADLRMARLTSV